MWSAANNISSLGCARTSEPLARIFNGIYNKENLSNQSSIPERLRTGCDTGGETVGNSLPDETQITTLYRNMYGRMVAYASSVLGDQSLAEEAVQDTFCIFCTKAEVTLAHENPQGWLMLTLQNVMRNMQRHRAIMNRLMHHAGSRRGVRDHGGGVQEADTADPSLFEKETL